MESEVQDKIFRNMPQKEATALKEKMDCMEPIRIWLEFVEKARQKVVAVIRELEEKGEIVL